MRPQYDHLPVKLSKEQFTLPFAEIDTSHKNFHSITKLYYNPNNIDYTKKLLQHSIIFLEIRNWQCRSKSTFILATSSRIRRIIAGGHFVHLIQLRGRASVASTKFVRLFYRLGKVLVVGFGQNEGYEAAEDGEDAEN